jgi:hypothetical protein
VGGVLDLGLFDRGCVNHECCQRGCWACATVAEDDCQRKSNDEATTRMASDRVWAEVRERQRRDARAVQQKRLARRSLIAGRAVDLGAAAVNKIARMNAEAQENLVKPASPQLARGMAPRPA